MNRDANPTFLREFSVAAVGLNVELRASDSAKPDGPGGHVTIRRRMSHIYSDEVGSNFTRDFPK